MQHRVENVDQHGIDVTTPDGSKVRIPARTVLWTAGVEASPLGKLVADACGAEVDHAGRVEVEPDCSVAGHPEVFVVGDMMHLDDLPGLAEVAMQSGRHAAEAITRRVEGKSPPGPLRYVDLGSMAYIARRRAVVRMGRVHLSGRLAWWTWLTVHLATLTTWKNRFSAFLTWLGVFIRRRRNQRAFLVRDLYPDLGPLNERSGPSTGS
jgi:NADH dehydrogenase